MLKWMSYSKKAFLLNGSSIYSGEKRNAHFSATFISLVFKSLVKNFAILCLVLYLGNETKNQLARPGLFAFLGGILLLKMVLAPDKCD